ncbi:MAG: ArnT family glycosyltransferase [Streptosporangiaceae bacterium]
MSTVRPALRPDEANRQARLWQRLLRSTWLSLAAVLVVATLARFWQLTAVGFNSDEAVYTGAAASLAGNQSFQAMFPVFRAHPLLFQTLLSLVLRVDATDWSARAFAAAIGVAAVAMTFLLGRRMYGRTAGLLGALLLALMPYHVIVSRQVLLDGLMTLTATVALYCIVRYQENGALIWLLSAGAMIGVTIITKETSVVLIGGLYAFFALTPAVRTRLHHVLLAVATMVAVAAVWPLMLRVSGQGHTGQNYLIWQLFRRSNHGPGFYFTILPAWIGPAVLAAALIGLVWLRREGTWRERLLLAWVIVPLAFFTIWPVKGFQYLLPIAPPLAVLAGRTLSHPINVRRRLRVICMAVLVVASVLSLAVTTWYDIQPPTSRTFMAGTGGVYGGRQAGDWVLRHVPPGARLLAIGPSMANILEYYGRHSASALSVSSNPHNRNPAYTPVPNPDLALRNGVFQYVVWDSYTADRSRFFGAELRKLVSKFNGKPVFTAAVTVRAPTGADVREPVIVIYQVYPS